MPELKQIVDELRGRKGTPNWHALQHAADLLEQADVDRQRLEQALAAVTHEFAPLGFNVSDTSDWCTYHPQPLPMHPNPQLCGQLADAACHQTPARVLGPWLCAACGIDITSRHGNARYCVGCANQRDAERRRVRERPDGG